VDVTSGTTGRLAGARLRQRDARRSTWQPARQTARLVCSTRMYEHNHPATRDFYWLRVPERIEFKLFVRVFRCLHGRNWRVRATLCGGHGLKKDAATCVDVCHCHAIFSLYDDWWPRVVRRCAARLEHSANQRHCVWDTHHLQASPENASFCHVIPLIFPNCAHEIFFCIFDFEKCWSNSYSVTL